MIFCVTHSSRAFHEARCTTNAFEQRFREAAALPPFESLPGLDSAVPYRGGLTLWRLDEFSSQPRLECVHDYRPDYKVQSAAFHGNRLLVYGSDRLEIFSPGFKRVTTVTDPWLVGGHTVFVDEAGHAWLTSAPANAVLRYDPKKQKIVERLSMPKQYGPHYQLDESSNLHDHYVPTDLQATHVNCAFPWQGGVLVTLLRPGAVGYFDGDRQYEEWFHGFRGCHGGKIDAQRREILLTDSAQGTAWFWDLDQRRVQRRLEIPSAWLHDVHPCGNGRYAATLGDQNVLRVVAEDGTTICETHCDDYGESVMFVSAAEVSRAWSKSLTSKPVRQPRERKLPNLGEEILPPLEPARGDLVAEAGALATLTIDSTQDLTYEYLWVGDLLLLGRGEYHFHAEVEVTKGAVMLGLLDAQRQSWLTTLSFDAVTQRARAACQVESQVAVRVILAANNAQEAQAVRARWISSSLRKRVD